MPMKPCKACFFLKYPFQEPTISDDTVVEESIDEPKIESPLRDQPVKSTTPFVYTTSTFYPPTTPRKFFYTLE